MRSFPGSILALLVLLASFLQPAHAQTSMSQEIGQDPPSDQYLNILPPGETPLVIDTRFRLHEISSVDDAAETFAFTGSIQLSWRDPRQVFDPESEGVAEKLFIGDYQFNEVFTGWWPQIILVNEAGLYESHGVMLRVRSDGSLSLIQTISAIARTDLDLRRYPFDRHQLGAAFEVLGFTTEQVVLQASPSPAVDQDTLDRIFRMPQWRLVGIGTSTTERKAQIFGEAVAKSAFIVGMDLERKYFYVVRLVVLPLMIIVMLSWCVFWMDKSSVGDRVNVSFIAILTVVAYQLVIGDITAHVSYVTLMYFFLNLSLFVTCSSVVINLWVGYLDRVGRSSQGDRLDHRCRWIYPLTYFGLISIGVAWASTLH